MAKPKLIALDDFIRGDSPLFVFDATVDGVVFNITDWTGLFTLTANPAPISNVDAVIQPTAMTKDLVNNTFSYQLTNTVSKTLTPGAKYYYDVQVTKSPADTNTFTIVRGTVSIATDFGV